MIRIFRSPGAMIASVGVVLLLLASAAPSAAGTSIDGPRGLLRVHSADPMTQGFFGGSIWGLYAREQYEWTQSPRLQGETAKFVGGVFGFTYAPSPYVELALRGAGEGQFVDSEPNDFSESKYGISDVGFDVKALLTPASQKSFMLGAELNLATATGNTDALIGTWDQDGFDIGGRLALTYAHMNAQDQPGMRFHLNTGYVNRTSEFSEVALFLTGSGPTPPRSVLHGDQFLYGAGLEIPVPQGWTLFTEWSGEYDVESEADFKSNPMRLTPGLRWQSGSGSFAWTSGVDISLSEEDSQPSWQVIAGVTFGGYMTPVQGLLLGTVRDAETGEPLPDVHVSVRNAKGEPVVSDATGRFKTSIEEGYAVVELAAEGYNPKTRVIEVEGHDRSEFDFTMTRRNIYGTVRGHLRDAETGKPLFGRVRVAGTNEWTESDPASGVFELDHVPEGMTKLEFDALNYGTTTVETRVVAGDLAMQDVSLRPDPESALGVLSGYVRDSKTGEVVVATVTARGKKTKTATVDPETGVFELTLEQGNWSVSALSPGYVAEVASVKISPREAQVANFDMNVLPKKMTLKGVFFDSGTATIKRESFAALEEAAQFLTQNPDLAVVIEGHTDSTGSMETNMALSQRRADAVMKFLVVNYGVSPKRLAAKGVGPGEPVASNETREGRALNRRIEFRLSEVSKVD